MACDSAWSWIDGNTIRLGSLQTKITRTRHGVLIGGAGDCSDKDVMCVFDNIRTPNDFPSLAALSQIVHEQSGLEFLIYFPDRQIWTFSKATEGAPELYQIKSEFAAVGSGSIIAMVAMDLGCSAHKAVQIACKWDMMSRDPIHVEQLPTPKTRRKRKS